VKRREHGKQEHFLKVRYFFKVWQKWSSLENVQKSIHSRDQVSIVEMKWNNVQWSFKNGQFYFSSFPKIVVPLCKIISYKQSELGSLVLIHAWQIDSIFFWFGKTSIKTLLNNLICPKLTLQSQWKIQLFKIPIQGSLM
jgi:hypothetical protein